MQRVKKPHPDYQLITEKPVFPSSVPFITLANQLQLIVREADARIDIIEEKTGKEVEKVVITELLDAVRRLLGRAAYTQPVMQVIQELKATSPLGREIKILEDELGRMTPEEKKTEPYRDKQGQLIKKRQESAPYERSIFANNYGVLSRVHEKEQQQKTEKTFDRLLKIYGGLLVHQQIDSADVIAGKMGEFREKYYNLLGAVAKYNRFVRSPIVQSRIKELSGAAIQLSGLPGQLKNIMDLLVARLQIEKPKEEEFKSFTQYSRIVMLLRKNLPKSLEEGALYLIIEEKGQITAQPFNIKASKLSSKISERLCFKLKKSGLHPFEISWEGEAQVITEVELVQEITFLCGYTPTHIVTAYTAEFMGRLLTISDKQSQQKELKIAQGYLAWANHQIENINQSREICAVKDLLQAVQAAYVALNTGDIDLVRFFDQAKNVIPLIQGLWSDQAEETPLDLKQNVSYLPSPKAKPEDSKSPFKFELDVFSGTYLQEAEQKANFFDEILRIIETALEQVEVMTAPVRDQIMLGKSQSIAFFAEEIQKFLRQNARNVFKPQDSKSIIAEAKKAWEQHKSTLPDCSDSQALAHLFYLPKDAVIPEDSFIDFWKLRLFFLQELNDEVFTANLVFGKIKIIQTDDCRPISLDGLPVKKKGARAELKGESPYDYKALVTSHKKSIDLINLAEQDLTKLINGNRDPSAENSREFKHPFARHCVMLEYYYKRYVVRLDELNRKMQNLKTDERSKTALMKELVPYKKRAFSDLARLGNWALALSKVLELTLENDPYAIVLHNKLVILVSAIRRINPYLEERMGKWFAGEANQIYKDLHAEWKTFRDAAKEEVASGVMVEAEGAESPLTASRVASFVDDRQGKDADHLSQSISALSMSLLPPSRSLTDAARMTVGVLRDSVAGSSSSSSSSSSSASVSSVAAVSSSLAPPVASDQRPSSSSLSLSAPSSSSSSSAASGLSVFASSSSSSSEIESIRDGNWFSREAEARYEALTDSASILASSGSLDSSSSSASSAALSAGAVSGMVLVGSSSPHSRAATPVPGEEGEWHLEIT